ncbi:unnamed protein product [Lathyrus oleraceus]
MAVQIERLLQSFCSTLRSPSLIHSSSSNFILHSSNSLFNTHGKFHDSVDLFGIFSNFTNHPAESYNHPNRTFKPHEKTHGSDNRIMTKEENRAGEEEDITHQEFAQTTTHVKKKIKSR